MRTTPESGVMTDIVAGRLSPRPLRFFWPRATRKYVARRFGVAAETAKCWLRDGAPAERREQFRATILAECDRLEAEIAELRAAWGRDR